MECVLPLDNLRLDFQAAECLIEPIVLEYISIIERGEPLPAIQVRFDGHDHFLQDGFHRVEAARRCGLSELRAEVLPGTLSDMEAEFREFTRQMRGKW